MVKPIYCNLLLIFSCLIYEAYGGHHNVRHIRLPSRVIPNNIRPYDSSSSSTTINDAGENTATLKSAAQPSSPRILRKSFSSNNGLGYDRNRGSVQDNKSSNYFGPNGLSSPSNTANTAGDDSAARSSSSRRLKKSFSSNDGVGYNRNRGPVQDMISSFSNNKSLRGLDKSNNSNDKIYMTLDDPSIQNRKDSMNYKGLNRINLSGLNNRNMQNDNISENQGIGKRQNVIISDIQDLPSMRQTMINSLVRRLGSLRQNSLPPLNGDDIQRISDGNENSIITNMINSNKSTFNDGGQKIVSMTLTECCINNKCRMLKEGEKCDIGDYFKDMKNTKQQNGNNNFIIPKLMSGKLMPSRLSSFNSFGDSLNEDSDTQETENPKNMRLGSMEHSTTFPSFDSSNGRPGMGMPGMGSSFTMPEKIKPNYPYSEPFGVSEDEANEIRNDVLQKSNFYRNKFDLQPFTLDDQLNNCAQDWANNMAKQKLFHHRPDNVYGENLYGNQNLKNLGEIAVDSWYNEMSIFTIGNEENFGTFHMTQLLWKKSTKLGVGVSQNPKNGMYYVVANYDPKGNLLDQFKENLPEITEEDIEEAKEADKRLKAELEKPIITSWSSGSSFPLGSGLSNFGPYFN